MILTILSIAALCVALSLSSMSLYETMKKKEKREPSQKQNLVGLFLSVGLLLGAWKESVAQMGTVDWTIVGVAGVMFILSLFALARRV